ncbi:MAG: hypothetical protein KC421_11875 [Anaerolineales bacterium]|nr:hypothetical protein [Anaerolineales bacterium]
METKEIIKQTWSETDNAITNIASIRLRVELAREADTTHHLQIALSTIDELTARLKTIWQMTRPEMLP